MPAAEAPGLQLVLDIGTHKILGLAVLVESGEVSVSAAAVRRHGSRAMRDGQVHDVPAVAATVRQVVRSLEETVGAKLTKASIAAAGRALRTARGRAEQIQSRPETCSGELEQQLEWQAVADAQGRLLTSLPGEQQRWGYYCIAHSRTGCWLDGDAIGRLAGQRGRQLAMEVLATFLPGTVVDSLEAVLREAGLEVNSLTLEPIAALEAVIPPTMRHLDLVLVDVGAGTSDIALTGGGTVQAYAMVPQAGDSITEAVSHGFLLDFPVADEVKRRASRGETVTVENVLGEPVTVDPAALAETIREATEQLADKIAGAICEWTAQKAPAAVLLVGGGSQTPGLAEGLAERLGLPKSRVAIRDRRAVRGVRGEVGLSGPEVVTALGIALRLARGREIPPIRVRVNGRPVSLFLPDRCTVREAARIAGIPLSHLVGSMGPGITVTVNGDVMVIPGSKGEAARIHVNGQPATLDTVLANQDDVELSTAARGEPPRLTVADLLARWRAQAGGDSGTGMFLDAGPRRMRVAGQWRPMPLLVSRNGRPARPGEPVGDRDVLEIRPPHTAAELHAALAAEQEEASGALAGTVWINGEEVPLQLKGELLRDGRPARPEEPLSADDTDETWEWRPGPPPTVGRLMDELGLARETEIRVVLNGAPLTVRLAASIRKNGAPARPDEPVEPGDRIEVRAESGVALYHILPHANLPGDAGPGRRLVLKVRGQEAGFTTPVRDGDDIVVAYE